MKIKTFNELNEKTNAAKAIAAGYNFGDRVYNKKMDKIITIADINKPTSDYGDDYCSLGSVGQFLDNYYKTNIHPDNLRTEFSASQKGKEKYENELKLNIDQLIDNKHYSVEELFDYINNYIK